MLFLVSLALPGLVLETSETVAGWRLLLTAWYGLLVLQVAWLANPLFIVALVLAARRRPQAARVLAAGAFGIGLFSFTADIWIANHVRITGLGAGFYVWMAAFALLAAVPGRRNETATAS